MFRLHSTSSTLLKSGIRLLSKTTFDKVMAANRGEIAIRVMRAARELSLKTVAIYSYEDRYNMHRSKADESYMLSKDKSAIGAYLDIPTIVDIAVKNGVSAIHPGYGFLSENPEFSKRCNESGIKFVGPSYSTMQLLSSKK